MKDAQNAPANSFSPTGLSLIELLKKLYDNLWDFTAEEKEELKTHHGWDETKTRETMSEDERKGLLESVNKKFSQESRTMAQTDKKMENGVTTVTFKSGDITVVYELKGKELVVRTNFTGKMVISFGTGIAVFDNGAVTVHGSVPYAISLDSLVEKDTNQPSTTENEIANHPENPKTYDDNKKNQKIEESEENEESEGIEDNQEGPDPKGVDVTNGNAAKVKEKEVSVSKG